MKNYALLFLGTLLFFMGIYEKVHSQNIPQALETVTAEDGSVWERVSAPGFGNADNLAVVSLLPFQDSLYAVTRNDETGFEIWRTTAAGDWEQVSVAGLTDNNKFFGFVKPGSFNTTDAKYNLMQNIWGDLIEFKGSLYLAVSSGYQGSLLYGSIGLEIWRFDGTTWQALVAPGVDSDEAGTITDIADCSEDDDLTARISDDTKTWETNAWQNCILRVEAAFTNSTGLTEADAPGLRLLNIVSNTVTALTVQQDEKAGDEDTLCEEHQIAGDPGRPAHIVPAISIGDAYSIVCGEEEQGFGEIWNKSIVDLEVFNGELYATVGLNYVDGSRIWKTSDGTAWVPTTDYSLGLFHGFDPDGNPIADEDCPGPVLPERNGLPVSSSTTHLVANDITGTLTLFTGGTGTSGCNGRGARVLRLDGDEWNYIVDAFVDENATGTNENGFGVNDDFQNSNFQAWTWAQYDELLFSGIVRLQGGCRLMYTATGATDDGAWVYVVGGEDTPQPFPDGFGDPNNIAANIYTYNSALYVGTNVNNAFNDLAPIDGADIWRATGPAGDLSWTRVTGDGFGDQTIIEFSEFITFAGSLYLAASGQSPAHFPGDEQPGASAAKVYRLASEAPERSCPVAFVLGDAAPELAAMRHVRDNVLAKAAIGRTLIGQYYKTAERLTAILDAHPILGRAVKTAIHYAAPLFR